MLAADGGTTVAIVIAVFTLIGTISANLVAWHKVRVDSNNATAQQKHEREISNVEVAQSVMAQTVTTLNERLQSEAVVYERKIESLREEKLREIQEIKSVHATDVKRLEDKIDRLTESYEKCKAYNKELKAKVDDLQRKGQSDV